MRNFSRYVAPVSLLMLTLGFAPFTVSAGTETGSRPNVIIVFADDQGYEDLGCFGSPLIKTPNIDRIASEGIRFTNFYAQTVCGPSRAALMTGCYPLRVAKKANRVDVHPYLHSDERTIAEILKQVGYATACFGKWDLAGHRQTGYDPQLLPTRQGFDTFFGTPTSNDRLVNLLRGAEVIEEKAEMSTLTRRYTDEAISFIRSTRDKPFFVYLAHTMPHTKLAASDSFRGKSSRGLYGDVIEEIDWNVGRILDCVQELEVDSSTYVIYTSDNGPWWIKKEHGGSAKPLRGAKTSSWEGGVRVPCVMRAPGRIKPGTVCDEIASTMDLLPTIAKLAGASVPEDRTIDGEDISDLIHGKRVKAESARRYYYYVHTHLQAVRQGKWKLHLPRPARPIWGPGWARHISPDDVIEVSEPLLFDLDNDVSESEDVASANPAVVDELLGLAQQVRDEIGDYDRPGSNARFYDPEPRRPDIDAWKQKARATNR